MGFGQMFFPRRADYVRFPRAIWCAPRLWSAVTSHRFGLSRPVATVFRLSEVRDDGARPPINKAVTGHRTPNLVFRDLSRQSLGW